jgi:hypothetical protein
MKINLLLNNNALCSGYLNIDPFATTGQEKVWGQFNNLDDHVEAEECEEIRAINIIDYYPRLELLNFLPHWIGKLRHGGVLTLGFVEPTEVAKAIVNGALSLEEINALLHGNDAGDWQTIKSSSTIKYLCGLLERHGMKILTRRVVNYQAIVKGQRDIYA